MAPKCRQARRGSQTPCDRSGLLLLILLFRRRRRQLLTLLELADLAVDFLQPVGQLRALLAQPLQFHLAREDVAPLLAGLGPLAALELADDRLQRRRELRVRA